VHRVYTSKRRKPIRKPKGGAMMKKLILAAQIWGLIILGFLPFTGAAHAAAFEYSYIFDSGWRASGFLSGDQGGQDIKLDGFTVTADLGLRF
jgi:hypothetical protein